MGLGVSELEFLSLSCESEGRVSLTLAGGGRTWSGEWLALDLLKGRAPFAHFNDDMNCDRTESERFVICNVRNDCYVSMDRNMKCRSRSTRLGLVL